MKKRIWLPLIAIMVMLCAFVFDQEVYAADASGTYGDLTWTYTDPVTSQPVGGGYYYDGTLTIHTTNNGSPQGIGLQYPITGDTVDIFYKGDSFHTPAYLAEQKYQTTSTKINIWGITYKHNNENIFIDNPPSDIYQYVDRIQCWKGGVKPTGSSAQAYCWLVWDKKEPAAAPRLHWIKRSKEY